MARTINTIVGGGAGAVGVPATSVPLVIQGQLGSGGFWGSVQVAPDGSIYFAESGRMLERRYVPGTGLVSTVAGDGNSGNIGDGGLATAASFSNPSGVCFDGSGNWYIADTNNQCIRRVDGGTGIVTTIAGTGVRAFSGDGGPALAAELNKPRDVVIDTNGDLLIADTNNHRIRKVNLVTGIIGDINTVCGGGASAADGVAATTANNHFPYSVAIDPATRS